MSLILRGESSGGDDQHRQKVSDGEHRGFVMNVFIGR